jgi:hypothetical protein
MLVSTVSPLPGYQQHALLSMRKYEDQPRTDLS